MSDCRGCEATFYDGQTSLSQRVTLTVDGSHLRITGHSQHQRYPLKKLKLSPPLGTIKRVLLCPDGCRCELDSGTLCTTLETVLRSNPTLTVIHRWKNSLKLAAVALAIMAMGVWTFISYGIPILAQQVTMMIPPAIEVRTGEETLALLDHGLVHPSEVPPERQRQLTAHFRTIVESLGKERPYQLLFRSSSALGANAFALPGGTVIITDDLIGLAKSDQELIAIMAHEIGHIKSRHALLMVIQNTSAGFLLAAITGDLMSTTALSAAIPSILVDAKFSHDMEREADCYAIDYLTEQQIPQHRFSDILHRLQHHHIPDGNVSCGTHIKSHSTTSERIMSLTLQASPSQPTNKPHQ